ncbi:holo-ACP synthase [Streptomyces anulatus]|uniref:4'-phosphopantetheinyl transferase superfamily protein n=1 Tax=Streptomyces anulatus TaxID=1892 RepID=A0ABZ1ZNU9_STRAQ|nr:4'-phosphopantetheinyl transferase superfamily protein [Streptomyces anulatus]
MRIGVDVLAIGELDRLHTRGWFRQHTYDQEELELAGSLSPSREREFLAGRFAAKEAVLKVLGTGFGNGISPAHVRVLRDGRSAPVVRLVHRAQDHRVHVRTRTHQSRGLGRAGPGLPRRRHRCRAAGRRTP